MKLVIAISLSCASLGAQTLHAIPASWRDAEAPSSAAVPGVGLAGHRQYVIAASALQAFVGQRLAGIAFRRNAEWPEPLVGGSAEFVVRVGAAAHGPDSVVPDFALNVPSSTEVFRGSFAIPSAPSTSGYSGWASPHGFTLQFSTPLPYPGGSLGIEIEGRVPQGPFWWPVDGVQDPTAGVVTVEGHACGARAATLQRTAFVAERALVVGATVPFTFLGDPGAPAHLLIGLGTFQNPIDLGFAGAPGCELRVFALASIATLVAQSGVPELGGIGQVTMALPRDPGLLGGEFAAQWIQLGPAITTSDTLRCRIAAAVPSLEIAVVRQENGGGIEVDPTEAPVLGLLWQ